MIQIIFHSGKTLSFSDDEFERIGDELEHLNENIILNIFNPHYSFIYETDYRDEMVNKEYINFKIV